MLPLLLAPTVGAQPSMHPSHAAPADPPTHTGIIPMPAALLGALWLLRDVSGAFGGGSSIAHAGHLGGAATGLAFFLAYRRGLIRPRGW